MYVEDAADELEMIGHVDLARAVRGESDPDARRLVREAGVPLPKHLAAWASDPVIDSPSGWSYRASQENGEDVDCWSCGGPLDDDQPLATDAEGYAHHAGCC
jgi:hypothetical protein